MTESDQGAGRGDELTPKGNQKELVRETEGINLADAGPGTGKTFTVTQRYVEILDEDTEPDDVLLMTFTESAAEEMQGRIIDEARSTNDVDYGVADLRDAPISTFHSYCNRLLRESGFSAPRHLGIQDDVSSSTDVLEDESVENSEFTDFYHRFINRHPEYTDLYRIINRPTNLLELVKSLAAKGVIPKKEGWFGDTDRYLSGDRTEFMKVFEEMNRSPDGNNSEVNSKIRGITDNKNFPDPPDVEALREGSQIDPEVAKEAFDEDRARLVEFVHDIYFEYMRYALDRNYLNFGFLMAFAYVFLHEDHDERKRNAFDYVIVDEFQDTSEIQLKLTMLLSESNNICVVGDWRQSIFSFQYASVNNIIEFKDRLQEYKKELNSDGTTRIRYDVDEVNKVHLKRNYRSTQEILDFAPNSFGIRGKKSEEVDAEETLADEPDLKAVEDSTHTEIAAYTSDDEIEAILARIEAIVENPDYVVEDDDDETHTRTLDYDDIGVLTRTRDFGVELYDRANELGIPVSYEGGVDLFNTDEAKLLLAWLRILEDRNSERGWAVVLEDEGYTLDETQYMTEEQEYPEDALEFREVLTEQPDIASVASRVFARYGVRDGFTDELINQVQSAYDSSYMNLGDLVEYVSENVDSGATYEVDSRLDGDTVNVHIIHSVKGLEYPVVFVSNINGHNFPSSGGGYPSNILYEETLGVRQRKVYLDKGDGYPPYDYDNWSYAFLSKCLPTEYDEERRLMYVAMTRAENYLYFTAETGSESLFFEDLPLEPEIVDASVGSRERKKDNRKELAVGVPPGKREIKLSPSSLGHSEDEQSGGESYVEAEGDRESSEAEGRGVEFGDMIHDFAEAYADGEVDSSSLSPEDEGYQDKNNVAGFLDSLDEGGSFRTEERCLLPLEDEDHKILIDGFADLVYIGDSEVVVVDYKTDRGRRGHEGYVKQVSAYHRTVEGVYKDHIIRSILYYTADDEPKEVDPLCKDELLREALSSLPRGR